MDDEKKMKRAAANVNERRRMQNINTGFEALRDLIDVPNKGKLSKSGILRHSVEMVRNVMSENQQLREQNIFLRNLYASSVGNPDNSLIMPSFQSQTTNTKVKDIVSERKPVINTSYTSSSPAKKRVRLSEEHDRHTSTPKKDTPLESSPFKSPRRYSSHVTKLLASPKRMTRSSVIQQNYSFYNNNNTSQNSLIESPTRQSIRIREREMQMTPSSSTSMNLTGVLNLTDSPSHSKIDNRLLFTPESVKHIPVRNAKRSLDAIIQAIDQIEAGPMNKHSN